MMETTCSKSPIVLISQAIGGSTRVYRVFGRGQSQWYQRFRAELGRVYRLYYLKHTTYREKKRTCKKTYVREGFCSVDPVEAKKTALSSMISKLYPLPKKR